MGAKTRFPSPRRREASITYPRSTIHTTCCSHAGFGACARPTSIRGIVYGIETDQTALHPDLRTSFHYDHVFGTVLNRFCVQAVAGVPLTVYGQGGQTRGFLNIRDTIQCVDIAARNPAAPGECRVFNQFTETFSINQLAAMTQKAAAKIGLKVAVAHIDNPRLEAEDHYYNPRHSKLTELGLRPHLLSDVLVEEMLQAIQRASQQIRKETIEPTVSWTGEATP